MFLMKEGLVTYDEALKHCTNPDDFALRVKGILAASDAGWEDFELLEKEKEAGKEKGKGEEKKVKVAKPLDSKMNDRRGTGFKP
jgi:twitching motility protein PilT